MGKNKNKYYSQRYLDGLAECLEPRVLLAGLLFKNPSNVNQMYMLEKIKKGAY